MSRDAKLQHAVLSELEWDPSVTAAHIGVTVDGGVVTLSGHVDSFAEKHAAELAAQRVKGVMAVADAIEVRLPFESRRGDAELAAAAAERLAWDVTVPPGAVKVTVRYGCVTLSGDVEWHFQQEAAIGAMRRLVGVTRVVNAVTIRPRADTAIISDDIEHALHRSWFFDPKAVTVDAEGGRVRLTGTVQTPHDRHAAAAIAWAAPGATAVENDIVVA